MDERSSSLKSEWKLLLHRFLGESDPKSSKTKTRKTVSADDTKSVVQTKKQLSDLRRRANKEIEQIKAVLESKQKTLENLLLVGSSTLDLEREISDLQNQGENWTQTLHALDQKLQALHDLES